MIKIKSKGNLNKTYSFLRKVSKKRFMHVLERYAEKGVLALSAATPKDTGLTSQSWNYSIEEGIDGESFTIYWTNSNVVDHVNIAMIIQYGHGTRNGAYVQGIDYINPAMQPIFDELADKVWKEVTS